MNLLKLLFLILFYGTTLSSCHNQNGSSSTHEESKALHDLFEEEWNFRMKEFPLLATSTGIKTFNDQLPSVSVADEQRRAVYWKNILKKLAAIDRSPLSNDDQVNYDLFKFILENNIAQIEFESYLVPMNGDEGFHTNFIHGMNGMPLNDDRDYQNYIARLNGFKTYMNQHLELMRTGLKKGWTVPKIVLTDYEKSLEIYMKNNPDKNPLYQPFENLPEGIPTTLKDRAQQAIRESIIPGFTAFHDFMVNEYRPNAKEDPGAKFFPNGTAYYHQRVKYFTTLEINPEEVYAIGEKEVTRIKSEMQSIINELQFKGSFEDFLFHLRTDPKFYAKTPEELLRYAAFLAKKIDGKLPKYFGKLPRLPYGVEPVPAAIAPKYTSGRYSPGSTKNHQAGNYWVNTYKLESRPLYALPALTLHEAVPGHHLQIALAEELENVPAFRQHTYLSAYGEGWALYCEWLGKEAGMYDNLYDDFGRLTYEMWRACRLVVDVGLHMKGWTPQQAIDFMTKNTALSIHEITTEVDRYIAWPGQALSYKMGELKIKELRKKAEQALGQQFDLRKFHDVVLSKGAVPMLVLEQMVETEVIGRE